MVSRRSERSGAPASSGHSRAGEGAGAVEHQQVEAAFERVGDRFIEAAARAEVEAKYLVRTRPRDGHGVPALADPVDHAGCAGVGGVAPRFAELEPGGFRPWAACPEVGAAGRGDAAVHRFGYRAARLVEARHEEGDAEIEALAEPP